MKASMRSWRASPGEPLYAHNGFRGIDRIDIRLPDGHAIAGVSMAKTIG
jgi:hypothetical protein